MSLHLGVALMSDVGLRRPKNDDSGFAGRRLLAVADGMGGHAGGDVASALTVDALRDLDATAVSDTPEEDAGLLTAAAARADERISDRGRAEPNLSGMGTTLTAALVHGDSLVFAHIGDSRAYLYRPADAEDGQHADLVQLTHDHTFVQSMVDEGQLSPEEAAKSPYRSVILRVLDGRPDNEPDTFVVDLVDGDRVLLCSDGLSDFVDLELVRDLLADADGPDVAARALVDAALDAGAPDNVTVLLAFATDTAEAAEPDTSGDEVGTGLTSAVDAGDNGYRDTAAAAPIIVGSAALATDESGEITVGNLPADMLLPADEPGDSGDDEERRYAPRPRSRWRWLRRCIIALAAVAVLVLAGTLGYHWTQQQYYVGTVADAGQPAKVAIYQGIAEPITGLELSHLRESVDLTLDELPTYQRERVSQTISAKDLAAAQSIVAQLTTIARRCAGEPAGSNANSSIPLECAGIAVPPKPTHTPTPTHHPTRKPTHKPTTKPTHKPATKPKASTPASHHHKAHPTAPAKATKKPAHANGGTS